MKKPKKKRMFTTIFHFILALFIVIILCEFFSLPLNYYYDNIQFKLFFFSLFISAYLFVNFSRKKQIVKAIMLAALPLLIYGTINYMIEAVSYGTWMLKNREGTPADVFALMNINLSLCDLKIVLSLLSLILWCWVWVKLRGQIA